MDAQEFPVDGGGQWQGIKGLVQSFVERPRVLVFNFLFECKVVGEMTAFMVTTEHPEFRRIDKLESIEQHHALHGEETSVNVISEEQILVVLRMTANFKEFHQVIVLTMNVTANHNRSFEFNQIGFAGEASDDEFQQAVEVID